MNRLQYIWYQYYLQKLPVVVPYEKLSHYTTRVLQLQIIAHDMTLRKLLCPIKRIKRWWHGLWWRRGIRFVKTEVHAGTTWRYYIHVKTSYAGCWLRTDKIRIWFKKI